MDVDLLYGGLEDVTVATESTEKAINEASPSQSSQSVQSKQLIQQPSNAVSMPFLHFYPLSNYTFGVKESGLGDWETSYHQRMANLEAHYAKYGIKRTVEAVLVTYEHNHPHILLLQLGDSNVYKL